MDVNGPDATIFQEVKQDDRIDATGQRNRATLATQGLLFEKPRYRRGGISAPRLP
jgi:hypothetical protein